MKYVDQQHRYFERHVPCLDEADLTSSSQRKYREVQPCLSNAAISGSESREASNRPQLGEYLRNFDPSEALKLGLFQVHAEKDGGDNVKELPLSQASVMHIWLRDWVTYFESLGGEGMKL